MKKGISIMISILLVALLIPTGIQATPKSERKVAQDTLIEQTNKLFLKKGWEIKSSTQVKESGEIISTSEFKPKGWYPTSVPSTVLTVLVKNGVYPNPYVGMNNMFIPDASDEFNAKYDLSKYGYLPDKRNPWKDPYWYRTEFKLPADYKGKCIWLNFKGINYRADLWLNGNKIADNESMVGMFQRFKFDITDYANLGEINYLAVKIYPVDYPGIPAPPQTKALGPFGSNGGNAEIGKNVAMQCSVGWDWIPAVRDRNMGIWQDVYISTTGPVNIRDPYVITDLPLSDTSSAKIKVEAEVINACEDAQAGILKGIISPNNFQGKTVRFEKNVILPPREEEKVVFSPANYPQLIINNPRLWWPNTYGEQNLYNLSLKFEINGKVSDEENTTFGIREVDSKIHEINGWKGRVFYINGKKIFIKGGAWVPDMMLNRDKKRYYDEIRLCRDANLNMVRIWGGGVTPPDEFFDACDKYGLLVWHDFWITGDCQGTWEKGNRSWPLDHNLFLRCAADTIKRIRNHPSLIVWTAGNEGYPCREMYIPLRDEILAKLDGTRPFIPSSGYATPPNSWGLSLPDNQPSGAYSGGPYYWIEPSLYYEKVNQGKDWLFKDEVGLPSVPPISSLRKFIPNLGPSKNKPFPLNDIWGYHDACEGNGKYHLYDEAIRERYGSPNNVTEYTFKAQFVNANSYRAIFEAVNHHMWDITSGVLLWKTNSAWPSVVWQLYDWYLRPNAGYYYTKKACEPLHVQLNLDDLSVSIINTHHQPKNNLEVMAKVYDFNMNLKLEKSKKVNIGVERSKEIFTISDLSNLNLTPVYFVKLELKNDADNVISSNFYWLSSRLPADFTDLEKLLPVKLKVSSEFEKKGKETIAHVIIKNPTKDLAFFVHLKITKGPNGEEVLPAFWEDNYFSLLPGEKKEVNATFEIEDLEGKVPFLEVGGWNIKRKNIKSMELLRKEG